MMGARSGPERKSLEDAEKGNPMPGSILDERGLEGAQAAPGEPPRPSNPVVIPPVFPPG